MSKPELEIYSDGCKEWRLNGKLHREDGPAVIDPSGNRVWLLNGKLHREDGPAVVWVDGYEEWWLNDKQFFFDEYKTWFINKISNPSHKLTDSDIFFIEEYLE